MAVGTTFDQWRKDVLFSAAEAVQESADTLESMYRMWIGDLRHGFNSEVSHELRRELHTALGTAKWQLEEFERAVNLSHENCSSEESIITRRRQFIYAIENQICHIEKALNASLIEEGKQPLRWVQLNEEERDDLAVFLSAAPEILQETKNKNVDYSRGSSELRTISDSASIFKDAVTINKDVRYVLEVAAKEPSKSKDEVRIQGERLNGQRRPLSSSDIGAWKIMIADEEDADRKLVDMRPETPNHASNLCGDLRSVESSTKLRWFRNSFWKVKNEEHLQFGQGLSNYLNFRGITWFAQGISGLTERSRDCFTSCKEDSKAFSVRQLSGRVNGLQRHIQGSQYHMQFGRSLQVTFLLVLSIVLIVPFVLYST
ncbi:uncharacterized protein LOC103701560 [Phoenix dactylifera]|uniref:Uncharacterized protein LOC103701560 n=1 Tax=Phoenix dactylifera TaxID=42345 RepID=A0A8B7BN29_PHODC|nr:uncharacterized protein LOC103701560 [Phoenix dactylifera]XP_008781905.1 uncharacterized protein LOC103701560 [Phoenix dactylifera]